VPPLKAPDGPPHDLGQFYIVIDPSAYSGGGFHERVVRLADELAQQPGARLPGRNRRPMTDVEVPVELWNLVSSLAAP
jgi:(2R)-3-sulfolactate dehydrogenase (NADP+)